MNSRKLILACLTLCGLLAMASTHAQQKMDRAAIAERLAPVGQLCLEGEDCGTAVASAGDEATSGDAPIDGEGIYGSVCMACHETGAAGAPVRGNEDAWASRTEQGFATLLDHAINGYNAMPARGGNPNLTDEEMHAAVAYLVEPVMDVPTADDAAVASDDGASPATDTAAGVAAPAESSPDGEALYASAPCAACHAAGVAGAPKIGDAEAWGPRIDKGKEALYASAINGIGAMPPRGGSGLSDAEIKAIVDYMVSQAE